MMITLDLTDDEINLIAYALCEMGNRRHEQALERKNKDLRREGDLHFQLANMIRTRQQQANATILDSTCRR